jgi:hypothetical protein
MLDREDPRRTLVQSVEQDGRERNFGQVTGAFEQGHAQRDLTSISPG